MDTALEAEEYYADSRSLYLITDLLPGSSLIFMAEITGAWSCEMPGGDLLEAVEKSKLGPVHTLAAPVPQF